MTEKAQQTSEPRQPKQQLTGSIRDRELMIPALRRAAEFAERRRKAIAG